MKRIVITGACGHLGQKVFNMLAQADGYEVCGLDLLPSDHPDIHFADFATTEEWVEHLKDKDVIIHLAGDRDPQASWDSAIRNNMDATLNLYHHAVNLGIQRFIFASSNWVQGGRRFGTHRLTTTLAPHPINAYGMSKLYGELTGAYFANQHGLSVICLRIGWIQWTHDNKPGKHMAMGRWGQEMWLSDRDFLNGMQCAIAAENIDYEVLNLMSDNPGMHWDIETTKRVIGYQPQDGHSPNVNVVARLQSAAVKLVIHRLPGFLVSRFPDW
ncbi:MAG: NAD-dependent epimerase/dehydratase family protein [Granulosicoccus sp.]